MFDGLLFPLLALDWVIIYVFGIGFGEAVQIWLLKHDLGKNVLGKLISLGIVLLVLGTIAVVDFWIIRRVWCAVNQPLDGKLPTAAATGAAAPQKTASCWPVGWKVAVLVCGLTLLWFAILQLKQREVGLLEGQIKAPQDSLEIAENPATNGDLQNPPAPGPKGKPSLAEIEAKIREMGSRRLWLSQFASIQRLAQVCGFD